MFFFSIFLNQKDKTKIRETETRAKKERKDGEHQLRLYMDMSAAEVGVWFNGDAHLYLRKVHHKGDIDGRGPLKLCSNDFENYFLLNM